MTSPNPPIRRSVGCLVRITRPHRDRRGGDRSEHRQAVQHGRRPACEVSCRATAQTKSDRAQSKSLPGIAGPIGPLENEGCLAHSANQPTRFAPPQHGPRDTRRVCVTQMHDGTTSLEQAGDRDPILQLTHPDMVRQQQATGGRLSTVPRRKRERGDEAARSGTGGAELNDLTPAGEVDPRRRS